MKDTIAFSAIAFSRSAFFKARACFLCSASKKASSCSFIAASARILRLSATSNWAFWISWMDESATKRTNYHNNHLSTSRVSTTLTGRLFLCSCVFFSLSNLFLFASSSSFLADSSLSLLFSANASNLSFETSTRTLSLLDQTRKKVTQLNHTGLFSPVSSPLLDRRWLGGDRSAEDCSDILDDKISSDNQFLLIIELVA